jgi:hypothetical protein
MEKNKNNLISNLDKKRNIELQIQKNKNYYDLIEKKLFTKDIFLKEMKKFNEVIKLIEK